MAYFNPGAATIGAQIVAAQNESKRSQQSSPKKEVKQQAFILLYASSDFSLRQLVTFDDESSRDQFKQELLNDGGREEGPWVILDSRKAGESANGRAKAAKLILYDLPSAY